MDVVATLAYTLTIVGPGSGTASPLDVTTTSANISLGTPTAQVFVTNQGPDAVNVSLGIGSGTVATPAGPNQIYPGATAIYGMGSATYLAAITASGTATLSVATGYLVPTTTAA